MTPQTLVNDFISGIADPQDIVLIVIGELLVFKYLLFS